MMLRTTRVVAAASIAVAVVASTGPLTARAANDTGSTGWTLDAAPMSVGPDQPVSISLRGSAALPAPTQIEITARRLDTDSGNLAIVLQAGGGTVVDSVTIGGGSITDDSGRVSFKVLTERGRDTAEALRLDTAGLYSLTVSVTGTTTVIPIPIFRVDELEPADALPVAMILAVDALPTVTPEGTLEISDVSRAEIAAVTTLLGASATPLAVGVRPELIDALSQSPTAGDGPLVAELATAIAKHRLLAMPYLHIDPSVAADSGLAEAFTAQLRSGEDALTNNLQRLPDRRVWVATDPLSPNGAMLVRDLGAVVIVQATGAVNDPMSDETGPTAQPTQPVLVPTPIDDWIAGPAPDPMAAAHVVAARLLLANKDVVGPKVVLMPDLARVDLATLRALVSLLDTDELISSVDVERLGIGRPVPATPASGVVADFTKAARTRADLLKKVRVTAEILPETDNRPAIWNTQADLLLDTRLTAEVRAEYETQLASALRDVQNLVVLQAPTAVNLGDRSTSIPITIRNDNSVPVTVKVRLAGAKLRRSTVSDEVTIEPGKTAFLRVKVSARTNGRFPVVATLLSPRTSEPLGRTVSVSVRVGQLAGLGLVITFGLGLVILTWWAQHLRRRWRREETAELERLGLPSSDDED